MDRIDFRRDVLPRLQEIPVRMIAEATDASISHASKVRNNHLIPHGCHWRALDKLAANGILALNWIGMAQDTR